MTTIRIQHISDAAAPIIVTRHRLDVQTSEPHTLVAHDELKPGQAITLSLHAGEIVTVDVENWDGESKGEDAKFVFGSKPKPLPEVEEETPADEAQEAVVSAAESDVPES